MSSVTITFSTDDAAFRNEGDESLNTSAVADILRNLVDKAAGRIPGIGETLEFRIRDINGNRIGYMSIEEDA